VQSILNQFYYCISASLTCWWIFFKTGWHNEIGARKYIGLILLVRVFQRLLKNGQRVPCDRPYEWSKDEYPPHGNDAGGAISMFSLVSELLAHCYCCME